MPHSGFRQLNPACALRALAIVFTLSFYSLSLSLSRRRAALMFRCPPRLLASPPATFSLLSKGTPVTLTLRLNLNSVSDRALSVSPVISASSSAARKMSAYVTEQHGSLHSDNYRLFFKKADDGTPVSPMHDIPLL